MGVVEKGNTIYVPADKLTENKVTVEWQQNLSKKSQEYYSVPFFNKSQGTEFSRETELRSCISHLCAVANPVTGDEQGVLFISTTYLDSFKSKHATGDNFTVVVDSSFQYGQNKEKTLRWLAYHDKSMNAYQVSSLRHNSTQFPTSSSSEEILI